VNLIAAVAADSPGANVAASTAWGEAVILTSLPHFPLTWGKSKDRTTSYSS
jgi:hypothetical protein